MPRGATIENENVNQETGEVTEQSPGRFAGMKRAAEVVKFGDLTKMEDLSNEDVLLKTITPVDTDFGPAVRLVVEREDGTEHNLITSGQVIYLKLLELAAKVQSGQESFPLLVRFVKRGRAWVIE